MTNADINGADAFMQGYVALLGFGITRIKNQMVDPTPKIKNTIFVWLSDPKNFFNLTDIMLGLVLPRKDNFLPVITFKF